MIGVRRQEERVLRDEGEGHSVRRGLGGEEEGVAVFDEGAVGQKAHGHPGDAVVVRHEAVLYGKCAHTMGRAGANSPGGIGLGIEIGGNTCNFAFFGHWRLRASL